MQDSYRQLLADALLFLKAEGESSLSVSAEDAAYFQNFIEKTNPRPQAPPRPQASPPPRPVIAAPLPKKPEAVIVAPEPLVPPPKEPEEKLPAFQQGSLAAVAEDSMEEVRALLKTIAPHVVLRDFVPSDAAAKRVRDPRSMEVAVLCFAGSPEEKEMLAKLAKAIDGSFAPAKLLEAEEIAADSLLQTETLKWVLGSESAIRQRSDLMQHYQELPEARLGKARLLFLAEPSDYLKDPQLKRSLWNKLCQLMPQSF